MSQTETWTVGRLLEWTTSYLKQKQAESPRLDAEVLLAEACGCQRIQLYTTFGDVLSDEIRTAFRDLVRRRAEGTPVAYLVGRREFYSLSFRVSPDVLIPRPETEFLVIRLLDLIEERQAAGSPDAASEATIADVGTGSGIIAICAAKRVPNSRVTAIDISPAALQVAADNAVDQGVADRIDFVQSDLFAAVPAGTRFDYIASNPPYVSTKEMVELAVGVRNFEPHLALEAGPKGTEVIERLLPQAAERLKPGGWLLIEISPMIDAAVRQLIAADDRWEPHPTLKDLAGLPRVAQAQLRREAKRG
jgi:release factor glutamine methyltransferase